MRSERCADLGRRLASGNIAEPPSDLLIGAWLATIARASGGVLCYREGGMSQHIPSPALPRAIAFIDGQNLASSAREAFGIRRLTIDLRALAADLCQRNSWHIEEVRFYIGMPDPRRHPDMHGFWMRRTSQWGRQGVKIWTRRNAYAIRKITCTSCGHEEERIEGREKGVDVRIALDVASFTARNAMDVAIIFSQDQDLFEVVKEARDIATSQGRKLIVASAFPRSDRGNRRRSGIRGTLQIPITADQVKAHMPMRNS
jgi:uncharacterized LabA/DUF88 family protein